MVMVNDYVILHSVIREGELLESTVLGRYSTSVDALNNLIEFSELMYPYYEKCFIDAIKDEHYCYQIVLSVEFNAYVYLTINCYE